MRRATRLPEMASKTGEMGGFFNSRLFHIISVNLVPLTHCCQRAIAAAMIHRGKSG